MTTTTGPQESRDLRLVTLVYKLVRTTKIGVITKLRPVYVGPYFVTRAISPMLYQIEGRRSIDVIHHDIWKLCRDRNVPLWMCRKRHQVLDKDVVVSLPVDPEDIPNIVSQEYMWDILLA